MSTRKALRCSVKHLRAVLMRYYRTWGGWGAWELQCWGVAGKAWVTGAKGSGEAALGGGAELICRGRRNEAGVRVHLLSGLWTSPGDAGSWLKISRAREWWGFPDLQAIIAQESEWGHSDGSVQGQKRGDLEVEGAGRTRGEYWGEGGQKERSKVRVTALSKVMSFSQRMLLLTLEKTGLGKGWSRNQHWACWASSRCGRGIGGTLHCLKFWPWRLWVCIIQVGVWQAQIGRAFH